MSANRGGRSIAVTGAAGYIGGRLIETLVADDRVERVLGFDVRPPTISSPKLVFDRLDVRSPELHRRFAGVDVVVHLAFVMDPMRDESEMRDVNVNGSRNVFWSAGRAGVRKIVYTSSAVVYGAHPDNDVPLTEESPLRANLDFSYAAHKLEVEYLVRDFRDEFPRMTFTVFRPAIVFGPNVDNAWSHALEAPVLVGVAGYSPPIQFVHEDDVARALAFAVFEDLDGAFNLAADGWLTSDEALEIIGRRRFDLSEPRAFSLVDRLWSLGFAEAPAGMMHYVMHPWVLSVDKLAAAGFRAMRSNVETLADTASRAARFVRLGRKRMRRADLVRGAGLGSAAVVGGVWVARRGLKRA